MLAKHDGLNTAQFTHSQLIALCFPKVCFQHKVLYHSSEFTLENIFETHTNTLDGETLKPSFEIQVRSWQMETENILSRAYENPVNPRSMTWHLGLENYSLLVSVKNIRGMARKNTIKITRTKIQAKQNWDSILQSFLCSFFGRGSLQMRSFRKNGRPSAPGAVRTGEGSDRQTRKVWGA